MNDKIAELVPGKTDADVAKALREELVPHLERA